MKFKFPFEKILTHRKNLEEIAKRDFLEALAILNAHKSKLQEMNESILLAREKAFEFQTAGGQAGSSLSQVDEFIQGQDIRIENQQKTIEQAEKRVEDLREILRLKAIDYKIIETLKEKKKEEFSQNAKRIELKEADDLNTMRFSLNKGK